MNIFYNPIERRLRAFWRILLQSALYFIPTLALGICIGLVLVLIAVGSGIDPTNQADLQGFIQGSPILLPASALGSLIAMFFSYWIAARWLDKRRFSDFGFHLNLRWWLDLAFGLFLGAFLMALIFAVELMAGWVTITGSFVASPQVSSFLLGLIMYVVIYFCVGIYEEMQSRGYLLRNLAEGLNFKSWGPKTALIVAYLISSSIFGFLHIFNPNTSVISTVNLIIAGLFLGLGYILTGELAISIGLHMTWNFFQGVVFGFPVSGMAPLASFIGIRQSGPESVTGGAFGPEAGLIGLAAILVGSILTVLWVKWRYGEARLQERLAIYQPRETPALIEVQATPLSDPQL